MLSFPASASNTPHNRLDSSISTLKRPKITNEIRLMTTIDVVLKMVVV